jgi:S-layer homology domain.
MKFWKNCLLLLLTLALTMGLALPAGAYSGSDVDAAVSDTAAYVYHLVKSPQVGSIGGEWAVLGLARSGYSVPDSYYQDYYAALETYVKARKGVLHEKKYTEYSRVIVALTAIGKDPSNVAGYNLLTPLGDYDKTIWQGLNGPVWALIALDSGNYAMPANASAATQATRQMYVDRILACELPDGGWSLTGGTSAASAGETSDPDVTGMALQALAKYQDQAKVKAAVQKALACMSQQQSDDGGFASWGTANSESCVQMIVALCELGVPQTDSRFVKNGRTMVDHLLTYYVKGGGFRHTADGSGSSQMATEQGLYGLVAVQRAAAGKNSLYRMSDARSVSSGSGTTLAAGAGLAGKNAAVKPVAVTNPGVTFPDIAGNPNQSAIETLAARGILAGKTASAFAPDAAMTRAQFTAVVVRSLGLTPRAVDQFADVKAADWCAGYVGTAYTCGIVSGTSAAAFTPNGTITRQQAAVMVARAAKLCGMDTAYTTAQARDVLAQFSDYVKCSSFAIPALAFCYDQGILDDSVLTIQPQKAITRGEVARMICQMLTKANLL